MVPFFWAKMFKNKHVLTALLVTPLLAVIAWLGVDHVVGERAAPAAAGGAYELLAQPDCRRLGGGSCTLRNAEAKILIERMSEPTWVVLSVVTALPLQGGSVAVSDGGQYRTPQPLVVGADGAWRVSLPADVAATDRSLRVAFKVRGATLYAEFAAPFLLASPQRPTR